MADCSGKSRLLRRRREKSDLQASMRVWVSFEANSRSLYIPPSQPPSAKVSARMGSICSEGGLLSRSSSELARYPRRHLQIGLLHVGDVPDRRFHRVLRLRQV